MRVQPQSHITAIATDASHALHRFTIPIRAFIHAGLATGDVSIVPVSNLKLVEGSSLVVQHPRGLTPAIITTAKNDRCPLVVDVDAPSSLLAERRVVEKELEHADLLTVSTEPLAGELRKFGFDPSVVSTAIEPRDWFVQPQRPQRTKARIGWSGSRDIGADDL